MRWVSRFPFLAALAIACGVAACAAPDTTNDGANLIEAPPGATPLGGDDVACAETSDCGPGEACLDGICQMSRCTEAYDSAAPLGARRYLELDREILVLDTDRFVDLYHPSSSGPYHPDDGSWDLGAAVADVAGGSFLGSRPQSYAAAVRGSNEVLVVQGTTAYPVDVGFPALRVAAVDAAARGDDLLVALGGSGELALCDTATGACDTASLDGDVGVDVAAGDVDGDGYEEPVVLTSAGGTTYVTVWNAYAGAAGEASSLSFAVETSLLALGVADVDGDGRAEILTLEDGGYLDYASDVVTAWSLDGETLNPVQSVDVDAEASDLASGDLDADGRAEVVVTSASNQVQVFGAGDGGLGLLYESALENATGTLRVTTADVDGDSAFGELLEGPVLVAGNAVPIAALLFPPYHRARSAEPSDVLIGDTQTQSEATTDTISLRLGLSVGYEVSVPQIFKAGVTARVYRESQRATTNRTTTNVGTRFSMSADPGRFGAAYGAVLTSCGCFHRYRYEIDDPLATLGGAVGKTPIEVFVPVGGSTTLWSSARYAAMAKKTGLPPIVVPYAVGDVDAYPRTPQALDGSPIAQSDLVFPEVPRYEASDLARTQFLLSAAEQTTNETTTKIGLNVAASLGFGGLSFTGDVDGSVAETYAVTIGSEAVFGGSIPPIPDDPSTPEDEYVTYKYAFRPLVYRQGYVDAAGNEGGFYVVTYAVEK